MDASKTTTPTDETEAEAGAEAPERAAMPSEGAMARRWGKDVTKLGFTYVPSVLLRGQARLKIGAIELALLVHLIDHWWENSALPFPSKARLAERLAVSEKTVQRGMARLEAEGLIRRQARHYVSGGQASNYYDLWPLVERLKPIADDMSAARAAAKEETRKAERPGLRRRKRAGGAPEASS